MLRFDRIKKKILNNKLGKYLLIGGFTFFFIKGLVWLVLFFIVGFGLTNNF